MSIQKCENCGAKFKYTIIFKALFRAGELRKNKIIQCRNCGTNYNFKIASRIIFNMLLILPMIIMPFLIPYFPILKGNLLIFIIGYLIYMIPVIILTPFIFKYRLDKTDDPY